MDKKTLTSGVPCSCISFATVTYAGSSYRNWGSLKTPNTIDDSRYHSLTVSRVPQQHKPIFLATIIAAHTREPVHP
eukprot:9503830-Pyramimonas_sp.AAC.5